MSEEHGAKPDEKKPRTRRPAIKRVPPPREFEHLAEALRDRFTFIHIS